jgi:protein-S-isoprenylcysteine O-methyltransferase Ste14
LQLATRRRMLVTAVVFGTLIVCDIFLWKVRPCDLLDWTSSATLLGEFLVLMGLGLRTWSAGTLLKKELIVRSGPYQFIRNPLYVGSFQMMLGFSILLHDWIAMWIVLGPVLLMYFNKVRQEEQFLRSIFPNDWDAYVQEVPRFVPWRFAVPSFTGFSWKQWLANDEYQAVIASAIGFVGIAIWYQFSTPGA